MSSTQVQPSHRPDSPVAGPFRCWRALFDAAVLVTVAGELDIATAPVLDAQLRTASLEAPLVVLDLRALEFVDLIGARLILTADQRLRQSHGRLAVVAGSRQVRSVFALIGADRELELVDRPSRLLACASRPARSDRTASQLLANADELAHMLRRAAGAGIDPRRVLLALGFRPHRTESDA